MKLSYEELEAKLQTTEAKLAETHRLLKLAIERIAALEERLNKNSKNIIIFSCFRYFRCAFFLNRTCE